MPVELAKVIGGHHVSVVAIVTVMVTIRVQIQAKYKVRVILRMYLHQSRKSFLLSMIIYFGGTIAQSRWALCSTHMGDLVGGQQDEHGDLALRQDRVGGGDESRNGGDYRPS